MVNALMSLLNALLFRLDPENAHRLAIRALALWGGAGAPAPGRLPVTLAGLTFPNPVGLAAGLDKDAQAVAGLFGCGFGAVEVGTLTPLPQPGNPRPRLFRLTEDRAVINRMGFNNSGIDAGLARLQRLKRRQGVLGVNVGANKDATDRIADYALGVAKAAVLADYVTINISSPNTPGLRDLQHGEVLAALLAAADTARHLPERRVPLFLKVAPDLDRDGIAEIAAQAEAHGIDALIVANTTISRPPLRSRHAGESGGLSGAPLAALARTRLAEFHAATGGRIALISAGGIGDAAEAYARIRAGATMVQLYSALVYKGPGLPRRIVRDLRVLLARDGFNSVEEAVGTGE